MEGEMRGQCSKQVYGMNCQNYSPIKTFDTSWNTLHWYVVILQIIQKWIKSSSLPSSWCNKRGFTMCIYVQQCIKIMLCKHN